MRSMARAGVLAGLLGAGVLAAGVLAPVPARAVFSGDMSPRAESGDPDYAAAVRARRAGDWAGMVEALGAVIARRPWHDNAHNLLGYGYRRLGRYDEALAHYETAIRLNPRHRQAMAYLGMAYLHMARPDLAAATLDRLGRVCRQVALTFSDGDFTDGCEEYRALRRTIALYRETGEVIEGEAEDWR